MRSFTRLAATLAVAAVTLAACGAQPPALPGDRIGTPTVVLRFATFDGETAPEIPGVRAFVDALESESGGDFRVEITYAYGEGAPDAETRLVQAIASGDLDGGWPSTRAFARAGIEGLGAIEAPMTLTSYEAVNALAKGPAAEHALAALDETGIAGLGLVAGDLRRPFAADGFLRQPDDWQGIAFRSYNSPIQSSTIEALGGTPRDLSFGWDEEVAGGRLQGIETGISVYAMNFSTEVPYATANIVLWPKVHVLALSQERLDTLTDEQRGWVERATAAALAAAAEANYDESAVVVRACESGVRFAMASDDDLAAMEQAVQPVIDTLSASEADQALLADVLAIAAEHPDAYVPEVPDECIGDPSEDLLGEVPDEVSALPDGQYRAEVRLDDLTAAGVDNGPGWTGTWTMTVERGTYVITCRAIENPGKDCGNNTFEGPLEAGNLRGRDDVVYFDSDPERMAHLIGCELPATGAPGHCNIEETYRARWVLDGDRLTFTEAGQQAPPSLIIPVWQKID